MKHSLSIPSKQGDALLIIDAINDLAFPQGEKLLPWALKLAHCLSLFRTKAHQHHMPVIYVNDHFGHWQSSFEDVYAYCTRRSSRGRLVSQKLKPSKRDYFVLKPRHSGFYSTALTPLLEDLKIKRLILSGIATNLCVLITAHDAHMQCYPLVILSDCCAAETDFDHNIALGQLQQFCGAKICRSTDITFSSRRL